MRTEGAEANEFAGFISLSKAKNRESGCTHAVSGPQRVQMQMMHASIGIEIVMSHSTSISSGIVNEHDVRRQVIEMSGRLARMDSHEGT